MSYDIKIQYLQKSARKKKEPEVQKAEEEEWTDDDDDADTDSENEMEFEVVSEMQEAALADGASQQGSRIKKEEGIDEKPKFALDAEGFALAEELIKSKKRRREIIEAGFHR